MGDTQTFTEANAEEMTRRLQKQPFFQDFPSRYFPTLAACAIPVEFAKGDVIFEEGDLANRFYLIESGKIRLQAERKEGGVIPLLSLEPGQVLGWSWLFPPHYWRFTAVADEPVKAIFLYGTRLRELGEQDTDFGYALMKRVSQLVIERLQDTRRKLAEKT